MKKRIIIDEFQIQQLDEPLFLKLSVGHRAKTKTSIWINGQMVVDDLGINKFMDSFHLDLGPGDDLIGKTLYFSIESYLDDDKEKTAVSLELISGLQHFKTVLKTFFSSHHKMIIYKGRIRIRQQMI